MNPQVPVVKQTMYEYNKQIISWNDDNPRDRSDSIAPVRLVWDTHERLLLNK
jgi:hypothetical protein